MGFESMTEQEARKCILSEVAAFYETFRKSGESFREGDRISYAGRIYDDAEMCNLVDSALDFWLTSGRYTDDFEKSLARFLDVPYCSLVNSGSSANLLAFMALTQPELGERQIKRGDEVVTVACGFPTTITPILQYGAVPVFCDMTIPQYNIDVLQLEEALSERTKAVMLAHTLGNPFDLKSVKEFCERHKLWLIEDNCDALGSRYTLGGISRLTGTVGDIGTSSFYPPHHMTMGEGGAVYTSNRQLHRIMRSLRDWGRDCVCPSGQDNWCGHRFDMQLGELPKGYDHKYTYSRFGFNLKATDLQASIGCAQLAKLPTFIESRKDNFNHLRAHLEDLEDKLILPEAEPHSDPSWFGFLITMRPESGLSRDEITRSLEASNIQTRLLFAGNIIKHPCFDGIRGTDAYRMIGNLPITETIMHDSFWIGVYPGMTSEMLDYMIREIRKAVS